MTLQMPPSAVSSHAHSHAPPSLRRLLGYSRCEHPLAIQLGGSNPDELKFCAQIAQELGYDEVNLNVGCPSKNVKDGAFTLYRPERCVGSYSGIAGSFGAVLMKTPSLVASCVEAMKKGVHIPVTVKHRIGVDDIDSYDHLRDFVRAVSLAGCDRFIIHARYLASVPCWRRWTLMVSAFPQESLAQRSLAEGEPYHPAHYLRLCISDQGRVPWSSG